MSVRQRDSVVIGAINIRVVRGLWFGLDTKAMEAVKQWRFDPALKEGKPVNVQISVEVDFRLY
jgi:protein TonB